MFELVETPARWLADASQPHQLGINKIYIPIWSNGEGNHVPSFATLLDRIHDIYDRVDKNFEVTLIYRWGSVRGRDKKTGPVIDKTNPTFTGMLN